MNGSERRLGRGDVPAILWDLLTFERLLTGPIVHLVYWAGLGLISLLGFSIVGGAVGLAIRDGSLAGVALGFATLVAGLLLTVALALLWRGASEFYLAVFRIAEDLRALRLAQDAAAPPPADAAAPPPV